MLARYEIQRLKSRFAFDRLGYFAPAATSATSIRDDRFTSISGRRLCAKSGPSLTAGRMGELDPERAFPVGLSTEGIGT
jgi:hypothetical protein